MYKPRTILFIFLLFCGTSAWATTPTKIEINYEASTLTATASSQLQGRCPRVAASGDAEFIIGQYSAGTNIISSIADYPSGSNTWVADKVVLDATNGGTAFIERSVNVASGSRGATVTLSSGQSVTQANCLLMNNIATSAPTDGSCGAGNKAVSSGAVACGSSVGNNGDEMIYCIFMDTVPTGSSWPRYTPGTGFTMIGVDNGGANACEIGNISAATNPTISVGTNTTAKYIAIGMVYKTATSGGSAPAGVYAPLIQELNLNDYPAIYGTALTGTSFVLNVPCPANTDVIDIFLSSNVAGSVTAISGANPSMTFTLTTELANTSIWGRHAYATGVSGCSSSTTITITTSVTPTAASNAVSGFIAALQNVGGGLDATFGTCNSSGNSSATSFPVSIVGASCTTAVANELVVGGINEDHQTVTSTSSSSGTIYDLEFDAGQYALYTGFQDEGGALVYMAGAGSNAITWTYSKYDTGGTSIGNYAGQALAWKPSAAGTARRRALVIQ